MRPESSRVAEPVTTPALGGVPATGEYLVGRVAEIPSRWRRVLRLLVSLGLAGLVLLVDLQMSWARSAEPPAAGLLVCVVLGMAVAALFRRRQPMVLAGAVTVAALVGAYAPIGCLTACYCLARYGVLDEGRPSAAERRRPYLTVGVLMALACVFSMAVTLGSNQAHGGPVWVFTSVVLEVLSAVTGMVLATVVGLWPYWWPRLAAEPYWWEDRWGLLFDLVTTLLVACGSVLAAGFQPPWSLMSHFGATLNGFLAFLLALPILFRRRYPALLTVLGAVTNLLTANVALLPVGVYALAKYGASRQRLVSLSLFACACAVPLGAVLVAARGTFSGITHLLANSIGVILLVATFQVLVPALLGMYAGARRQVVENLRDRNTRLVREQHLLTEKVRLEERTRIAREMHDVVAHRVSLMVVHAGALEVGMVGNERASNAAHLIGEIGRQALDELRQVLGVLRMSEEREPAPLTPQPTLTDLTALVEQSRETGMTIDFEVLDGPHPVGRTVERTAYRVVQEALTNVHKHAGDPGTLVRLRYRPDGLDVLVENDPPSGPPAAQLPSGGHGLVGLRERVTVLGGTFEAGPRPSGGFRVFAVIPVGDTQ